MSTRRPLLSLGLDVLAVLVFAAAGRRSHAQGADAGVDLAGTLSTAWPFLAALLLGWALVRGWRRPTALAVGVTVWFVTVAGGMGLRAATGDGTALPFVLVATGVLGALLVGWRLVAGASARVPARGS